MSKQELVFSFLLSVSPCLVCLYHINNMFSVHGSNLLQGPSLLTGHSSFLDLLHGIHLLDRRRMQMMLICI